MKKLYVFLCFILLALPVLADDLTPEPLEQSIKEYDMYEKAAEFDGMSHVVWKLYIFYDLSPKGGGDRTPKLWVAGLTPDRHYRVILSINQLYNYLRPLPKAGDVIIVDGYIKGHYNYSISTKNREFTLKALSLYTQGAMALPNEHFENGPASTPSSTPSTGPLPTATPGGQRR